MEKSPGSISLNVKTKVQRKRILRKVEKKMKNPDIHFPSVRLEGEIFKTCVTETTDPVLTVIHKKARSVCKVEKRIPKVEIGDKVICILPLRPKRSRRLAIRNFSQTKPVTVSPKRILRTSHQTEEYSRQGCLTPSLVFKTAEPTQKYKRKDKKQRESINLLTINQSSLYFKIS